MAVVMSAAAVAHRPSTMFMMVVLQSCVWTQPCAAAALAPLFVHPADLPVRPPARMHACMHSHLQFITPSLPAAPPGFAPALPSLLSLQHRWSSPWCCAMMHTSGN